MSASRQTVKPMLPKEEEEEEENEEEEWRQVENP